MIRHELQGGDAGHAAGLSWPGLCCSDGGGDGFLLQYVLDMWSPVNCPESRRGEGCNLLGLLLNPDSSAECLFCGLVGGQQMAHAASIRNAIALLWCLGFLLHHMMLLLLLIVLPPHADLQCEEQIGWMIGRAAYISVHDL